jgi:formate--tetrahydrofolate ligase
MVDNSLYWNLEKAPDARRILWRRTMDMNDRALRQMAVGLGGAGNGYPREDGFDIVPASEIMAVFCLANDLADLKRRLSNIIVGQTRDKKYVRASDLEAAGAMTALLKDALAPNLAQTIENNPAFIHGGPFANIAHGCNTVVATKTALKLADYVVTEAGFGADLGAEKFLDIKCRKAGLKPDAAVVVATIRALKMHGGVAKTALKEENVAAVEKGFANLARHVENLRKFGLPVIVGINRFSADTEAESAMLRSLCAGLEVECVSSDHWANGGPGAADLAKAVVKTIDTTPSRFKPLYPDDMPLWTKAQTVAREIYAADDIIGDQKVRDRFKELQEQGYGNLPVCIAKTQYSFSTDPEMKGAPKHHVVPIREVRLSAGAEFVVVICGDIMTMPGLPKVPSATKIDIGPDGKIVGLF